MQSEPAPPTTNLLAAVCRCDQAAIAAFVGRQTAEQRAVLLRGCALASTAVLRSRCKDTSALLHYKTAPDPRLYCPADPQRLRQLLTAAAEGDSETTWRCVADLDLPSLDAYGYIVGIIPILLKQGQAA